MSDTTCEATFKIVNRLGLHARAATKFVQAANQFKADVTLEKDGQTVNGKSIMGVLMLVAAQHTTIVVTTTGPDARECLDALGALIDSGFGEN